ncbi:hypothetical protein DdX_21391 [Ditylenchus destructor]|uniref:Uncharacterized protein n=1 Tax=Ditylenchus destructor TaxID=166010 RepID=A0AAD4MGJ2_9BILA|nr:hypothetical protein DdX_21391 [Ditylenchus destructor]
MQKVLTAAPATAFPSLKVFWSVNNTNASGSIALGQIGTTFFVGRSSGAEIYVLGKEDVDTDEFDAPVIAHEWGHYYQASFSRDDSTGGAHSHERARRSPAGFLRRMGQWLVGHRARTQQLCRFGRARPGTGQQSRSRTRSLGQSGLVP